MMLSYIVDTLAMMGPDRHPPDFQQAAQLLLLLCYAMLRLPSLLPH